jgi:MerR family transcriptional regulator, thiopeptide resistance regulator
MEVIWKIGELAKQTGLTVRTLHHYDQIGLLHPSHTTTAGHRLYTADNVEQLQQIVSLKHLGFSLEEIKQVQKNPGFNSQELLRIQITRLNKNIQLQEDLRAQLKEIYEMLRTHQQVTPERFLTTIQLIKISQSDYFNQDQIKEMKMNYKLLDFKELMEMEENGQELISDFRKKMESGISVDDPVVFELAQKWMKLFSTLTVDFQSVSHSAESYYSDNPNEASKFGMDEELYQYIRKALSE